MIDSIVSHLQANCAALSQVARADSVGVLEIDNAALLKSLLSTVVGAEVYPLILDESASLPSATYQLVRSARLGPADFPLLRRDTYIQQVRASEFPQLVTVVDDIRSSLLGYASVDKAGAIEITDTLVEYEHDQRTVVCSIESEVTHLAAASQELPAAFTYLLGAKAEPSKYDNKVKQRSTEFVAVVLISKSTDLESIRIAVQDCLLGYQPSGALVPLEFVDGEHQGVFADMTLWQEIYKVDRYISESG